MVTTNSEVQNSMYWEIPRRDRWLLHNPGKTLDEIIPTLTNQGRTELEKEGDCKWIFMSELSDCEIRIYRDIDGPREYTLLKDYTILFIGQSIPDIWSYTLTPTSGENRDVEGPRVKVPGTMLDVQKAAVDTLRRHCSKCNADVTFGWQVITWSAIKDGPGRVTDIMCKRCDAEARYVKYAETGIIDSKIMVAASLEVQAAGFEEEARKEGREARIPVQYPHLMGLSQNIHSSTQNVQAAVSRFEQEVWFNGLQNYVQNSKEGRWSAKFGDIEVLALASAARWRATINGPNEDYFVDVICAEDSSTPTMGLNYMRATEEQAIDLLEKMVAAWKDGSFRLDMDSKVSILGF